MTREFETGFHQVNEKNKKDLKKIKIVPELLSLKGVPKISGCPKIPVAACTSKKYEFNNWDKFTVNYPFGRGVIIWGNPIYIKRNASEDDIEKSRGGSCG